MLSVLKDALLFAPTQLYRSVVELRNWTYDQRLWEEVRFPFPVLCVGNLAVGGTGKTPGVIWLVRHLLKQGRRPAVVSRGYGRAESSSVLSVSDGFAKRADVRLAGDEPFLMANKLPEVPVLVGADRVSAVRRAWEKFDLDCVVLDDGFQHRRLYRDLDMICFDALEAQRIWGEGQEAHLLPSGRLREPLKGLERAGVLFLTKANFLANDTLDALMEKMACQYPRIPLVAVDYQLSLWDRGEGKAYSLEAIRDKEVLAVSGLAQPASFEKSLSQLGALVKARRFRDHHFFTAEEQASIREQARREKRIVVVTEKDAVRLPADFPCLEARLDWRPRDTQEKGEAPWLQSINSTITSNTSAS